MYGLVGQQQQQCHHREPLDDRIGCNECTTSSHSTTTGATTGATTRATTSATTRATTRANTRATASSQTTTSRTTTISTYRMGTASSQSTTSRAGSRQVRSQVATLHTRHLLHWRGLCWRAQRAVATTVSSTAPATCGTGLAGYITRSCLIPGTMDGSCQWYLFVLG